MAESIHVTGTGKAEKYESLLPQLNSLVEGEQDFIANLSNIMAALKFAMDFFWVGIYFVKDKQLVLGPFQGPVACTRIALGKGVCGKSWESRKTIVVEDVDQFPGHIACSSLSRSEIVLPALDKNGEVFLILDVDSEQLSYFDETDKKYLEQVMQLIIKCAALQPIR
jgi:L-methionine (R)-S-oxide reductase